MTSPDAAEPGAAEPPTRARSALDDPTSAAEWLTLVARNRYRAHLSAR